MSFTSFGPLGHYGWGTTTAGALAEQIKLILTKYESLSSAINSAKDAKSGSTSSSRQAFPPLTGAVLPDSPALLSLSSSSTVDIFAAAIFTDDEAENWPAAKRIALQSRKRDFSDQPPDVQEARKQFKTAALQSLQRRHNEIQGLPDDKYNVIQQLAGWVAAVAVNLRLREILLYPLIRDQISGGKEWYIKTLHNNDSLRSHLRTIRHSIYTNAADISWYSSVAQVEKAWQAGVDIEKEWLGKLSQYLTEVEVPDLRSVVGHMKAALPEINPPTSHDLNYGQQLKQMYEIGYTYLTKTGYLQGLPRPRHEPDWACTSGFEDVHPSAYGPAPAEIAKGLEKTGLGIQQPKEFPEPKTSNNLPPIAPHGPRDSYLPFGSGVTRIIDPPDAASKEDRQKVDKLIKDRDTESVDAHKRAYLARYGSVEAEELAKKEQVMISAADKATALKEFLTGEVHTSDLQGSYYYNEVTLAFRNHGTHWESLGVDITPLGEHYLLIHYDVQYYKALDEYRLKVYGCVQYPLTLTFDQVKQIGKEFTWTMPMIMECSGNGRAMMKPRYNQHVPWGLQAFGCYCWTGFPLRLLLERVGVRSESVDIIFTGYDAGFEHGSLRYFQQSIGIHDPVVDHSLICWAHNGVDLLPEHGFPLRLMVPAYYGNVNVKWLRSIELVDRKFKGVYRRTYSYTRTRSDNDIAVPSAELRPHAMLKPIGYPDFTTRKRTAIAGIHNWVGRAWVGGGHYRAIISVELSMDAGATWQPCRMEPRLGIFAWLRFQLEMDIKVGVYTVMVRATDNLGQQQKVELDDWNFASMQDDAMQRIELVVVDRLAVTE